MSAKFYSPIPGRVAPWNREPNLPRDRYGRWTLVAEVRGQTVQPSMRRWVCVCECGTSTSVVLSSLRHGSSASCGCLTKEVASKRASECHATHGMSASRTYNIWNGLLQRCENKNNPQWVDYGGRGIGIAPEWRKFENFLADMGPAPKSFSLDRVDNSKGYSRENCRWADAKTQNRNKRNNVLVAYGGANICLKAAAEIAGLNYKKTHNRLNKLGWPISRALGPEFSDPI